MNRAMRSGWLYEQHNATASEDAVSFSEKIKFLESVFDGVERIETHSSFVFLTDDEAYKIKKPILLDFLDHRSLAAREHACREELRLNRQLAGEVYLGLVPMVLKADGSLAIGTEGAVVDWVVKMRRLPADRMLDRILCSGNIPTKDDISAVSTVLLDFYRERRREPAKPGVLLAHLSKESATNARHLIDMREHLGEANVADLSTAASDLILQHIPEIEQRDTDRLIVEGHGDLRPEHICLTSPPVIYDRIEFAPEMLMIDMFDEVNYLGLECAMLGVDWIGPMMLESLRSAGFSAPSSGLMSAYSVFRCLTRARLSIDHLLDPEPRTPEKWPAQAKAYLARAAEILKTKPG